MKVSVRSRNGLSSRPETAGTDFDDEGELPPDLGPDNSYGESLRQSPRSVGSRGILRLDGKWKEEPFQ